MSTSKLVLFSLSLVVTCFGSAAVAQEVAPPAQPIELPADLGCSTCQSTTGCDCDTGGFGGRFFSGYRLEGWRSKLDHNRKLNQKIVARNDAWPKPFECLDRQSYHNVWLPLLDAGYEQHSILSDNFFDPETNELNRLGIHRVAGVMQNLAGNRKAVYVTRHANPQINEARLAAVQQTIQTYYGQLGAARVALTDRQPWVTSGIDTEVMNSKRIDAFPSPMIQIGTGGSVAGSVGAGGN